MLSCYLHCYAKTNDLYVTLEYQKKMERYFCLKIKNDICFSCSSPLLGLKSHMDAFQAKIPREKLLISPLSVGMQRSQKNQYSWSCIKRSFRFLVLLFLSLEILDKHILIHFFSTFLGMYFELKWPCFFFFLFCILY